VNGEVFESTVAEAVLLPRAVHASMQSNPLQAVFELEFANDSITLSDFSAFL
jgi:hypothetical protein